jgi:hypothetical protein
MQASEAKQVVSNEIEGSDLIDAPKLLKRPRPHTAVRMRKSSRARLNPITEKPNKKGLKPAATIEKTEKPAILSATMTPFNERKGTEKTSQNGKKFRVTVGPKPRFNEKTWDVVTQVKSARNPYMVTPNTTTKQAFTYKKFNKETRKKTVNIDREHYRKQSDIIVFKRACLIEERKFLEFIRD